MVGFPFSLFQAKIGHPSAATSNGIYSSATRPTAIGNRLLHLTQPNLLCRPPFGISIVTAMYLVPQCGQAKAIGSDLLVRQRAGMRAIYAKMAAASLSFLAKNLAFQASNRQRHQHFSGSSAGSSGAVK